MTERKFTCEHCYKEGKFISLWKYNSLAICPECAKKMIASDEYICNDKTLVIRRR